MLVNYFLIRKFTKTEQLFFCCMLILSNVFTLSIQMLTVTDFS